MESFILSHSRLISMSDLDRCIEEYGSECFFCQSVEAELVHFIDGNRSNNSIANMRPSCGSCHTKICSPSTEYIQWSQKLSNPPIEEPDINQISSALEEAKRPYIKLEEISDEYHINSDELREYINEQGSDLTVDDVRDAESVIYRDINAIHSAKNEMKSEIDNSNNEKNSSDNSVEHISLFPDRKEIVVSNPKEKTITELSKTAHLEDMNGDSFMYQLEKEDVWNSPFESFDDYVSSLKLVVDELTPRLRERLKSYWERADMFELQSKDDKTQLVAESSEVFENVAKRNLEHNKHYTKFVDDKTLQVTKGKEAHVKREMYNQGYLVEDNRVIEDGSPFSINLKEDIVLRDYQRDWIDNFIENRSGTFVGPSGSGKTVATLGLMSDLDQETLIIVPKRELAQQWENEIKDKTDVHSRKIGQYHGGEKNIRPITIATYDTARKSRHRKLFNSREWGLLVLDEAHHSVAPVWERVAKIQSKSRLGLTATPVRESGNPEDIYSLIGPPVGTDWHKLFKENYVQKPEVRIEKVPWSSESKREQYERVGGHMKRRVAAENPKKLDRLKEILDKNPDNNILIFVEWIDQGETYSDELDIPFIYGETPHKRRDELFEQMRSGERSRLIISRVGDEGIDIPNVDLCVICSTLGSSSSQTAQRVGRTMRPTGSSRGVLLATKGSNEEDFIRSSTEYLAEQGIEVTVTDQAKL